MIEKLIWKVTMVLLTAYQTMREAMDIEPGQHLLVTFTVIESDRTEQVSAEVYSIAFPGRTKMPIRAAEKT